MTFLGVLPSNHFWVSGKAITAASISAGLKFNGNSTFIRIFPLKETGYEKLDSVK